MNKKYLSYIIISILCLNLLPQTCNAFVLNEAKTVVIYDESTNEEGDWEEHYLPTAKVLKLVPKGTTMLDLAKAAESDNGRMIADIMNRVHYERHKLLVKWEKDNKYIDEEREKYYEVTPAKRLKLLAEIREEEEKEKKESNQFIWNNLKVFGSIGTLVVTYGVAKWVNRDINQLCKIITTFAMLVTAFISVADVARGWITRLWPEDLTGHPKIKRKSDIINLPNPPKNYERVDVYSYGL